MTLPASVSKNMVRPEYGELPAWTHPDVIYWYLEWQKIRDCVEGEKAIKDRTTTYLPKLEGMASDYEYRAYLDRGTFYNFTGRTIMALVGTLMRRRPVVSGFPETLKARLKAISDEGTPFHLFAQQVASEVLTLGRVGVLLDLPEAASTSPNPYLTMYTAENILDWDVERDPVTGRKRLTRVVLREWERIRTTVAGAASVVTVQSYAARYRVLSLENNVYTVAYYTNPKGHADLQDTYKTRTYTPTRRGVPLDVIPFRLFGVLSTAAAVEKSPSHDIACLNISHYRSYTHLEHGRFFTGLPIYNVEVSGEGESDYVIGPSQVWETPQGCTAKILECNGQGLKFLENACATKEAQAASLGGRMIGVTTQSTAETDNQTQLKERNEQALLLSIAMGLDEGFTTLLGWFAAWANERSEDIEVEFNKDFLFDTTGAREFRAIQSMYEAGILPIEVVYDAMRKAEVIPDFMTKEEFLVLLESKASFPNNPNFDARKEGFPNAQAKATAEAQEAQRELDKEISDDEIEADKEKAKTAAKAKAAAPAPAPFGNNQ